MEDMSDPIDCPDHPASAKAFITCIGVVNGFEHHPHNCPQDQSGQHLTIRRRLRVS
jgi:hypothetical protein